MPSGSGAGVLLGLACGDALGQPVEGWPAERIAAEYGRLDSFVSGARGLGAGARTDDTEQAVRLARSLRECGGFDPDDVAVRFLAWYREGPTGIGGLTRAVLRRIDGGEPWREASRREHERRPEGRNAGNGSVMRCAPLAVAFDLPELAAVSRESSRLTHFDPRCVYGCELLNRIVAALSDGDGRFEALDGALAALPAAAPAELRETLAGLEGVGTEDLRPSGYVVDTLEAALYHGLGAETAEGAIVDAVNTGGDADTVGAVAGAVAGAHFGADDLPERWLERLDGSEELRRLGRDLEAGTFDAGLEGRDGS